MNTAKIMTRQMRLSELLKGEVTVPDNLDVELTGIEMDSRQVEAGDLFFACKGAQFDGRAFIDEVIAKGARAVLVDSSEDLAGIDVRRGVPVIPLHRLSCRIGKIAARFFDYPAAGLWLIGVTGTNGKTSCTQFIAQCFASLGRISGVCGTLGYGLQGQPLAVSGTGPGTTPDAITVQRIFEEIRIRRGQIMAMEVSSHGLKQNRVNVSEFDMAVFTNLSRDHLDYHGSMTAYGEAKLRLFNNPHLRTAVVNLDDIFSADILNSLSRNVRSHTYSLRNHKASVHPRRLTFHPGGFTMQVVTPWGEGEVNSRLLGAFNVSNLLATLTAVLATEADKPGFDFQAVLDAASAIQAVKGRMEVIGRQPVAVVVDYAHTPDGLEKALQALRRHYTGRTWCVFGCGGDRDKGKRPLMAGIAEELADQLIITDDNPRGEPSRVIIEQIQAGLKRPAAALVESDRARAIELAVMQASPGDVVLIAGKGHEEYQDVGGNRMMFSDVKQARLCLNKRFNQTTGSEG